MSKAPPMFASFASKINACNFIELTTRGTKIQIDTMNELEMKHDIITGTFTEHFSVWFIYIKRMNCGCVCKCVFLFCF